MKFSEAQITRTEKISRGGGAFVAKVLATALLLALSSAEFANAQGNSRRILRQFGYNKEYAGVIRGFQHYRTTGSTPFERDRISRLKRITIPVPPREVVADPQGEGEYRIVNRIVANRRRATIRGNYFGVAENPRTGNPPGVPAKATTRVGVRIIRIVRNNRRGKIVSASYLDRIVEFDRIETQVILARWLVRGRLR